MPKYLRLTSVRVLGTAWSCPTHLLRIKVARGTSGRGNRSLRRGYVLETLLCPHAGLLNASGLGPKTFLVSLRLGREAAMGPLGTEHPGEERKRGSNPPQGLRALGAEVLHPVDAV